MRNYSTAYKIFNDKESIIFAKEKSACEYLGVSQCTVASCYRRGEKCKGYEIERLGLTSHGETKTRLFKIWDGMHERCERIKHPQYKNYGGRGIKICAEWQVYELFAKWARNNGYAENLTLDRIDVNGNYEPSNCRWATMKEQMSNKRTNHFVMANGERMTLSQCSERFGVPVSTVRWRDNHHRDVVTGSRMQE